MSVNTLSGSNTLRWGQLVPGLEAKEEVRLRISSTSAERYQVFQRVLEPITNEKGQSLDLNAIVAMSTPGSNASGTLYLQSAESWGLGEQLIYTSSQGGESDSFVVEHILKPELIDNPGNYNGRILYSVRSMTSGAQDQVTVNVFFEGPSAGKAKIEGSRTPDQVKVENGEEGRAAADFVRILLPDPALAEIKIYQEVAAWPQTATGDQIAPENFIVEVAGNVPDGIRVAGQVPLDATRTLIYSGQGTGELQVRLSADKEKAFSHSAGEYIGKLRYIVETAQGQEEALIDLEYSVQPVFTINVELPPEGVSFAKVLPTDPPREKEVLVTVRSNLHTAYQVLQDFSTLLTNAKGDEINKENFEYKVDVPPEQKGRTKNADYQPVETGERPIFFSDAEGSSSQFKVVYRLQGYAAMKAGDFSAPVKFSLGQN